MNAYISRCVLVSFLLALGSQVRAGPCEDWRPLDSVLAGASITMNFLDWAQTREIAAGGPGSERYEKNRTLGPYPSPGRVNRFFLGKIAFDLGVACLLPRHW